MHTLHRFEPLAPRYANDSDEPLMPGFNRWVKTWTADYVSVEEIYWKVPGDALDAGQLPSRAFDSPQQNEKTRALFDDYNRDHDLTPEIDAGFATLAAERIHAAPLRYYVWLPAARIADMWLRPRTELFPSDPRWWEFNDDQRWLALSIGFGVVNLLYVVMAGAGLRRSHKFFGIGLFVLFHCGPVCLFGNAGKSRASLYTGMLSRGDSAGLGSLPVACINFQIWKGCMLYGVFKRYTNL